MKARPHDKPLIVLNFKAYSESSGKSGWALASAAQAVAASCPAVEIIVCPQASQLESMADKFSCVNVFAQSADANSAGAFTGSLTVESIAAAGCAGTLINHAEKKIPHDQVKQVVELAINAGIKVIACADSVAEAKALSRFSPWAIAVEPPQLIGTGVSVSTAKPRVVTDSVKAIKSIDSRVKILVGAGVSNAADVGKSIELGAEGVLLASAFVKSKQPRKLLLEMARAAEESSANR